MREYEFYSVVLRRTIMIPKENTAVIVKKGRKFLVGNYAIKGRQYQSWKIIK